MIPWVYTAATWLCQHVLLPPFARITVKGLENLPLSGPLIIASNHLNDADPAIICTRIRRRIVFMAKVELFRIWGVGHYLRAFGAIPVRRHEADLAALRLASAALAEGLALCIFPEGTRTGPDAKLIAAYPGAGFIALRSDAPVLPIAITGSQRLGLPLLFLRPFLPRYRVMLTIGQPFQLAKPQRLNGEAAAQATQIIMGKIAALLPPEYRGYYGSAPDGAAPSGSAGGTKEEAT